MSKKAVKGKKSTAKGGQDGDEGESYLQAIVLTDSYETRFQPFTLEKPRCLLPLANTPMIEYTFEFLANAGVDDVFVYCGNHTDQIEQYLHDSKWSPRSPASPFRLLRFIRSASTSIGDAMRDIDGRDLITGDFLVVSGDVVSNYPLEEALRSHRARREADKNAIMTMVLREAAPSHRTQAQIVKPVFVLDPEKQRCLHYEEMRPDQESRYVSIDSDLLKQHEDIEMRTDLIDCHIDICTPDVLALWTDSFDYESPRKHFLFGVLKDYELNGKTIHTHVIKKHYAARVRNLQAYDAVSKDILERWTYPLSPESNLLKGQRYRFHRGFIYKEDNVSLARTARIEKKVMIGQGTTIEDGSRISNSIVGRRCSIGRNVVIDGAYIWDDVVIKDGARIIQAIVACNAVIGQGCEIQPGALISFGVEVKDNEPVEGSKKLTRFKDGEDGSPGSQRGSAYEYEESDSDIDEVDRANAGLVYNLANLNISESSISTLNSEGSEEIIPQRRLTSGSFAGSASGEGDVGDEFHTELSNTIFESLQKGDEATIISLELQSLRLSNDATYHQVRRAVSSAFIRRITSVLEGGSKGVGEAVKTSVANYKTIFDNVLFDQDSSTKYDQVDFLLALQIEVSHRDKGDVVLLHLTKTLYEMEVLEEDGFNQWWADARSVRSQELRVARGQTEQFIKWLASAAEEDSDDEEEESDEESE